jgi:5-formyltetrahydrofolate cyclo-ligase
MAETTRQSDSKQICQRLQSLLAELSKPYKEGLRAGAYQAINSEVCLQPLTEKARETRFAYPKVKGLNIEFFESDVFQKGSFSILEPSENGSPVDELLQVLLVPGVAFDRGGGRLGYGKGFYDRWLQSKSVLKIGVAFSCQLSEQRLSNEQHDVAMDLIVTEKFILGTESVPQVLERAI